MTDYIKSDGTPGFDFANDFDSQMILAGELAASLQGFGVHSTHSHNILSNGGNIQSGEDDAVRFSGSSGGIIINYSSGIISGFNGIRLFISNSFGVVNSGSIFGLNSAGVMIDSSTNATIANNGVIYGRTFGIRVLSPSSAGVTINNVESGVIRSNHHGIRMEGADTSVTLINNSAKATISGGDDSIKTLSGAITLNNLGTLVGDVSCEANDANDVVVNRGSIIGSVFLGSGSDRYVANGVGRVTAGIHGGDDGDKLIAGPAKERFFGDADSDTFVFNSVRSSLPTAKRDVIADFKQMGADKIDVHAIDADHTHAGRQHFVFIGKDSFAHYHAVHPSIVGMLRFNSTTHRLQGNVNADLAHADFEVGLPATVAAVHAADLLLV